MDSVRNSMNNKFFLMASYSRSGYEESLFLDIKPKGTL